VLLLLPPLYLPAVAVLPRCPARRTPGTSPSSSPRQLHRRRSRRRDQTDPDVTRG